MSIRKLLAAGAILSATGVSMIAAPAATAAPGASPAQSSQPAAAQRLACTTYTDGPMVGTADCYNPTNQTIAFRAKVVCGYAPDQDGGWVTLNPRAEGSSSAECPWYSTGVGSVSWEEG